MNTQHIYRALADTIETSSANEQLYSACRIHQSGRYAEALPAYEAFVRDHPSNFDALHLMGVASFEIGRHQPALDLICRAIELNPTKAEFHHSLGAVLSALGKSDDAIVCYRKSTVLQPEFADSFLRWGLLLADQGNLEAALPCLRKAESADPSNPSLQFERGKILQRMGAGGEAATCFGRAVKQDPNRPEFHVEWGHMYLAQGWVDKAASHYRHALRIQPDCLDGHAGLGQAALMTDPVQTESAAEHFAKALQIRNDFAPALTGEMLLLLRQERFEEVRQKIMALMREGEPHDRLAGLLVRASIHCGETEAAAQLLETLIRESDSGASHFLHFHLGCLRDQTGEYEVAFDHFDRGRRLKGDGCDNDEMARRVDRLIGSYDPEKGGKRSCAINRSEIPVFLVGPPHSGRFLVERIFSAHPQGFSMGNFSLLHSMIQNLDRLPETKGSFPEAANDLTGQTLDGLAQAYLRHIKGFSANGKRIIDASPFNIFYVGLFARLFPKSRVICCRRHPLDLAISIFAHHSPKAFPFNLTIEEFADYYRQYQRLMDYWKRVLGRSTPDVAVIDFEYEKFREDPEAESRRILEATGLDGADFRPRHSEGDPQAIQLYRQQRSWGFDSYLPVNHWEHYRNRLKPFFPMFGCNDS